MDPEQKMALRLAAEKRRQFGKKSLFNLNEDEELTHAGLALDDSNLNDKLGLSDDEDDDMLDAKFVKEQHFGGGLLTKLDGADETDKGKPKSKKEWIDEIIAESKKKKAESRKEKEEQYEAVSKLNSELQSFMKLMANQAMTKDDKDSARKNCEFRDYDTLVQELVFDRTGKAKAVEKLKTPEELISEERQHLLNLEADRVRRMKGEKPSSSGAKPKSADDLDDGFTLTQDQRFHVSYKDGEIMTHTDLKENDDDDEQRNNDSEDEKDGEEEEAEEEEEEEEEEDKGEEEKEDTNVEEKDSDEESDRYSDILEESESEGDEEIDVKREKNVTQNKKVKDTQKKEMMEAAKKEIPYTFEVPQDYEAFWALLENHSPQEVGVILERMITCNHPSLGGKNKDKCDDVFAYILQTLHILTDEDGDSPLLDVSPFMYVDQLVSPLYTITQVSPVNSAKALLQVIEEKYEDCSKTKFKKYPLASTFVFLKIAGLLFPASDYIHPVMTPVMVFLCQLLGQARISTCRDITAALFTAHLLHEYLSLSKRFVPELTNTMNGLLFMAVRSQDKTQLPLTPPFKCVGPTASLLVLETPVTRFSETKLVFEDLNNRERQIDDDFRINAFCKAVKLLKLLSNCWIELPSIRAIMTPTKTLLQAMTLENYTDNVKKLVEELLSVFESLPSEGNALVREERKPTAIHMFEPAIEKIIDGVKKRHGTKEYLEKQKLIHKLKREKKGARKAVRGDTAFLARQQLQETLQSDADRKRKVGQIMSGLQMQEGDFKKMKKKK
ncbi:nucleolar protein 14-like isoform X2 [Portunus trituberculatus]|nr:nucleolar protein 14-like isoform X2 [Portunus trituberculatus]